MLQKSLLQSTSSVFAGDCLVNPSLPMVETARDLYRVIVYLVESTGGIAPEPLARIRRNARLAKTKNARDSTKYGEARVSPRSYYTHHTQRISAAAVRADAQNARVQIACLKQSVCAAA